MSCSLTIRLQSQARVPRVIFIARGILWPSLVGETTNKGASTGTPGMNHFGNGGFARHPPVAVLPQGMRTTTIARPR